MAYKALYRKWRPLIFDDVVGQEHITKTLKNEVELERLGHAYLFCGSRGTGKTSTARILSRAINCLHPKNGNPCNQCENCMGILDGTILDITEIDAASNNGVDNIRDLREEARFSASRLKNRVYIVDEVHMLSTSAFNALLKILEEPPQHVRFILATTEAHKVPDTILSRCQRFDFKRINTGDIEKQLKKILDSDGYTCEDRGLRLIAEKADGSMRDALSLLDQCMAIGTNALSYEEVASFIGVTENEYLYNLAEAIGKRDTAGAFSVISDYVNSGKNPGPLLDDFIRYMRNILMFKYLEKPEATLDISTDEIENLRVLSQMFSEERIIYIIRCAAGAATEMRYAMNARVILEIAVVKMINPVYENTAEAVAARLGQLEDMIRAGAVSVKEEKPKVKVNAAPKKEIRKAIILPEGGVGSTVSKFWSEIKDDLIASNRLQIAFTIENAKVAERNGGLLLLYSDREGALGAKNMLNSENLAVLKETINKIAGIDVNIFIDAQEATIENDRLYELDERIDL